MKQKKIEEIAPDISFFENKLLEWEKLLQEQEFSMESERESETVDIANRETMLDIQAAKCDRKQETIKAIKSALKKIKEGTYGICEETGEQINWNRLKANPIARFSIEAQQIMEKKRR